MKYIDRLTAGLSVAAGYLWEGSKCLGKIISIDSEFYTIIPQG
jgi:hypothetical protein